MTRSSDTSPVALEDRVSREDRLFSPSTARNREPIAGILGAVLPEHARVLEIGSGTGEHAVTLCQARPDIAWQPSDPDETSRRSQAAWAAEADGRIAPPLALDLLQADWDRDLAPVDAIVCINVIHISPWRVAGNLVAGAGRLLGPGRPVFLYGPYREGEKTAPSNLDFDRSLKSRNPDWGVRELDDVVALFESRGFALERRAGMPANNLSLVFVKQETA
ncbi:DUF938 domain-containing protein [Maricaulis sp.]|uniref:DUF938 domain-containing protein n=1 Tax=Maricaulis sp. TaxID=1486257 RepID=UPI00262C4C38|nr:DUF938 domain-containing protein [Maricaulis sp.]